MSNDNHDTTHWGSTRISPDEAHAALKVRCTARVGIEIMVNKWGKPYLITTWDGKFDRAHRMKSAASKRMTHLRGGEQRAAAEEKEAAAEKVRVEKRAALYAKFDAPSPPTEALEYTRPAVPWGREQVLRRLKKWNFDRAKLCNISIDRRLWAPGTLPNGGWYEDVETWATACNGHVLLSCPIEPEDEEVFAYDKDYDETIKYKADHQDLTCVTSSCRSEKGRYSATFTVAQLRWFHKHRAIHKGERIVLRFQGHMPPSLEWRSTAPPSPQLLGVGSEGVKEMTVGLNPDFIQGLTHGVGPDLRVKLRVEGPVKPVLLDFEDGTRGIWMPMRL
jgi:hypothetical protein